MKNEMTQHKIMNKVKEQLEKYEFLNIHLQEPHGILTVALKSHSEIMIRSWVSDKSIVIDAVNNPQCENYDLADPDVFEKVAESIIDMLSANGKSMIEKLRDAISRISKDLKEIDDEFTKTRTHGSG